MIKSVDILPDFAAKSPQEVRFRVLYKAYGNSALFFKDTNSDTLFALSDGDLTVLYGGGDLKEIASFISFLSPNSVFCDEKFAELSGYKTQNVLCFENKSEKGLPDISKTDSKAVYNILEKGGLSLPPYEYFAPDFCLKINKGLAVCAYNENAAAVIQKCDDAGILTGIASLKKGEGGKILAEAIKLSGCKKIFAVCETALVPFYLKNHFLPAGKAGYWRKFE